MNTSKLIIIGARAMGREAFGYALECGMEVKGFLDSDEHALDGFSGYAPILGAPEKYKIAAEDVFVCALGDPAMKRKYVEMVVARGGRFVSIVHPTAYLGKNVKIGVGCIICPHTVITSDTLIDDFVIVNVGATINHDNQIGEYSTICPGCHLAGRVILGKEVFLGIGALLIPRVSIGDFVYVAAGAVVTKSFNSGKLIGVPAIKR